MASAVLASRNEPHWGEGKVYMRKYSNNSANHPHLSNFNPNPNPNPNYRQIQYFHGQSRLWQTDEPRLPKSAPPAASEDSSSFNRKAVNHNGRRESDFVTYNLRECSRAELKAIKNRFISELDQVRSLRARIDAIDGASRSNFPVPEFSAGGGGGDYGRGQDIAPMAVHGATNEFLAGKKKPAQPPKEKKVLGHKRGPHFASGGRYPKRSVVKDLQNDEILKSMMKRCKQILSKLMKHNYCWVFNAPVDPVACQIHDYYQVIKYPMDLGTVKSRLDKNTYRSPGDFASDVRLTFNNALTYNPEGDDAYVMANTLLQLFDDAYKKFEAEINNQSEQLNQRHWSPPPAPVPVEANARRSMPDSIPIARASFSNPPQQAFSNPPQQALWNPPQQELLKPPVIEVPSSMTAAIPIPAPESAKSIVTPISIPKVPKPKVKDMDKRDMSFEEKSKLGANLQNLPQEKMENLVMIIKKRNPQLAQDGDEIELDIEALDNETLWELDRFVSCHKKAVSKVTRQGIIENSIMPAQTDKLQDSEDTAMTEAAMQKNKKGGGDAAAAAAGEEDVDIGDEIPINNFPPVEIEKDTACGSGRSSSSSSSSSSGDSSSSSDSDSGSSSGSESDEEDSVQSPFVEPKEPV